VGVVGDIVAQFWEYVDWCSRLEAASLGVCDLVLGPAGDKENMATHLEEVAGRLRMAQGGHETTGDLTSQAVTPGFKAKPDAHRMYAQDQVVIHTVRM
jgi:hypothetical protein